MSLEFFDWVKRRTIAALFSSAHLRSTLVFKGGNLLDIALQVSTRASVDLDFSIEGEFQDAEIVRVECEAVLTATFEDEGYRVFDVTLEERPERVSDDLKDFWGGYKMFFKLISQSDFQKLKNDLPSLRRNAIPLSGDGSAVFSIDISKFEYCANKQSFIIEGQEIFGYSPEMAIAEKLRAICQQMPEYLAIVHKKHTAGRARDFVDIHALREAFLINVENAEFHELVKRIFAIKRVPLHLIGRIADHSDDHRADFVAVQATVKSDVQLEDFDFYVEYVVRECRRLESLWNV
jgi:predicted nucleotidyltransferase component of viral defense system